VELGPRCRGGLGATLRRGEKRNRNCREYKFRGSIHIRKRFFSLSDVTSKFTGSCSERNSPKVMTPQRRPDFPSEQFLDIYFQPNPSMTYSHSQAFHHRLL
jgi:hypothetical protein